MRVLAFNCSPKMDKGNTALVLGPFLDGMREKGAEVELYYVKKLKINPCQGELNCYLKTPGECFQEDDMQLLYPKLRESDMWVFATPVYWDGVTGPMKNLMDRLTPLSGPFYEVRDGKCTVTLRDGVRYGKVALVSTAGCWEMANFDALIVHIKAFCVTACKTFAGALLRPHADVLKTIIDEGAGEHILDAARESGRQLVTRGEMSPEILGVVSREVMSRERYIERMNHEIRKALR